MRSAPCPGRTDSARSPRSGSAPSRSSDRAVPAAAERLPTRHKRAPLPRARSDGIKHLAHFAVDDSLLVAAPRVGSDHAAPEAHGAGVAQVLDDLPASGEAAEDQLDGLLVYAAPR